MGVSLGREEGAGCDGRRGRGVGAGSALSGGGGEGARRAARGVRVCRMVKSVCLQAGQSCHPAARTTQSRVGAEPPAATTS